MKAKHIVLLKSWSCLSFFHVLCQVLDKHKAMDNMVDLLQVYPEEDDAYGDLLEATTQLYHYLLQPFRDIRELATLRRQQIKVIQVHRNKYHLFSSLI